MKISPLLKLSRRTWTAVVFPVFRHRICSVGANMKLILKVGNTGSTRVLEQMYLIFRLKAGRISHPGKDELKKTRAENLEGRANSARGRESW